MSEQYVAVAQVRLVPSPVLTGSMTGSVQEKLERVHAVQVADQVPQDRTVCGWRTSDGQLLGTGWAAVALVVRCRRCQEEIGDEPGFSESGIGR